MVVIDDHRPDVYRNLIEAIEENIRLVAVRGEVLYGDETLVRALRNNTDFEVAASFDRKRTKLLAPNCTGTGLPAMSLVDTKERLQRGLNMDASFLVARGSAAKIGQELARCPGGSPAAGALLTDDAKRFLACRFNLPYEKTVLSPLTTNEDPEFMSRLMANPNLPAYLKALPDYYRQAIR